MHKTQIIKQHVSTAGDHKDRIVYLTVKSRTPFNEDSSIIKCVLLVKTSRQIIFQSRTINITIKDGQLHPVCSKASQQVKTATAVFYDAVYGHNKIIQLPLW